MVKAKPSPRKTDFEVVINNRKYTCQLDEEGCVYVLTESGLPWRVSAPYAARDVEVAQRVAARMIDLPGGRGAAQD